MKTDASLFRTITGSCSPRSYLVVGMLQVLLLAGCAHDHRMSLADFLQTREAARQAHIAKIAAAPESVNLDAYIGPYRVGAGDELTIELVGADGTSLFPALTVRVDRRGAIDLPVVGKLDVGDQAMEDVEDLVLGAYIPTVYREATCHVSVIGEAPTRVLVMGAVAQPGLIPLRRTERNLLFAIAQAGGVSDQASGRATLRRLRRPLEEVTLDLKDPLELRAAITLDPLSDGDVVTVEAAPSPMIYVGGLVTAGGVQQYDPGTRLTVLQALARAQGPRTDLFPREGTLIRHMPDGSDAHVKLDLLALADGRAPNFDLEPGDILWVPHTAGTRIIEFINRNVFLRAGATLTYNFTSFESPESSNTAGGRGGSVGGGVGGGTLQNSIDPLGFLSTPGAPKRR